MVSKLYKLLTKDHLIIIGLFTLATTIFFGYYWFFVPGKLQYLYQNWDGPSYVLIAKSFYQPSVLNQLNTFGHPPNYFANHFPLYPLFIRLFSFLGYFQSMLFVSLLFSLLFILAFYHLVKQLKITKSPLLLTLPLIIFPPRWFIVSHVGSSEPIFLFFLTLSLIYFFKQKFLYSAIFAALCQLTRAQGILLFAGYFSFFAYQFFTSSQKNLIKPVRQFLPYFSIPISLILLFLWFQIQYNDFFAFFHSITQFRHLRLPPFKILFTYDYFGAVAGDVSIWKEVYILNYLLYLIPIFVLFRKKFFTLAILSSFLFLPIPFLVHIDVSRYSLLLLPFVYLGLSDLIARKDFLVPLIFVSPAILVYAINFTLYNLSP